MTHRKTARDTQRRSDLNTLLMAYEMYYEKQGTYSVENSGYPHAYGNYGYVNKTRSENLLYYDLSLVNGLINAGYLSTAVRDPGASEGWVDYYVLYPIDSTGPCLPPGCAGTMKSGICIYAKLEETPISDDDQSQWDALTNGSCQPRSPEFNYVVGHFK